MSETMREALPIIFMYGCVLLLGPFVGFAMWAAFDGDRLREVDEVETTSTVTAPIQSASASTSAHREGGASSAA